MIDHTFCHFLPYKIYAYFSPVVLALVALLLQPQQLQDQQQQHADLVQRQLGDHPAHARHVGTRTTSVRLGPDMGIVDLPNIITT